MNSRSNSLSKISNSTIKRESFSFVILNIDAKFQESQVQIIVKSQQDVYFLNLNQPFTFDNESKLQIQVIINNKMFGSVSFKPKVLNKIPHRSIKWLSLLDPSDDFYDGDFNEDDFDGPRVLIQFNRTSKQDEKQPQEHQNTTQRFLEKTNDISGISTNRSSILKEINGELKSNRTSHRDSQNCIYGQQNLKNVYKQGFNMKLVNEELCEQITTKEEFIKKMNEQIKFYKVKLEFKEKENEVLSQNIQKVQAQCNNYLMLIQQDNAQKESLEISLKNAENKIQKLTDYLIDFKEKYQQISQENERNKLKIMEYQESQNQEEENGYYKEQLEKKKLIIENLRQQIQEIQDAENIKEVQISNLQREFNDYKKQVQEEEQKRIIQMKIQDDEKSLKIEQLIEEVTSQKNQVDSLLEQVKQVLDEQNVLKQEIEDKKNIIKAKEKIEQQLAEEVRQLKAEQIDSAQMIEEQSQHIKNQAKQINEQNNLILRFKQTQELQKEKTEKECAQRNQITNENKKLTSLFLEQKQKCAETQLENKKIQENLEQKQKIINQLSEENNLQKQVLSKLQQQNNSQAQQQSHNFEESQQFWQKIPIKIADLEKNIAEYDLKHQFNLPLQQLNYVQSNSKQVETPTIGLGINQQEESQKTDQYLMISGNTNQYYQSQTVTPFLQVMNCNSQCNREDTNIPIQMNNYNQITNNKQSSFSPFNGLSFTEEIFNLNNQDESKMQSSYINQQNHQQSNQNPTKQQFQQSLNQKINDSKTENQKNELMIKNNILISELKNKRKQFRAQSINFCLSSPNIKSSDVINKLNFQLTQNDQQNTQIYQNNDQSFPCLSNENNYQLQSSGAKTKRSQSISQLAETKYKKSPCSSSQRRNSTNIETKRWKI